MTSLLNDEFYDHLHKLEDKSTNGHSWVSFVEEGDKNLEWCNTYINNNVKDDSDEFVDNVRTQLDLGVDSYRDLERRFHMDHRTFRTKLKANGLEKEVLAALRFWNGFVVYRFEKGEMFFARTVKHCLRLTGDTNPHVLSNRLARRGNYWEDMSVHHVRDWKTVYPNFQIDRKDLLNNDIIKLAG